jgi:hypothetical protein
MLETILLPNLPLLQPLWSVWRLCSDETGPGRCLLQPHHCLTVLTLLPVLSPYPSAPDALSTALCSQCVWRWLVVVVGLLLLWATRAAAAAAVWQQPF